MDEVLDMQVDKEVKMVVLMDGLMDKQVYKEVNKVVFLGAKICIFKILNTTTTWMWTWTSPTTLTCMWRRTTTTTWTRRRRRTTTQTFYVFKRFKMTFQLLIDFASKTNSEMRQSLLTPITPILLKGSLQLHNQNAQKALTQNMPAPQILFIHGIQV